MNSRNELILSRVRLRTKQANQNNLEDGDLLDIANEIQDEIFSEAKIKKEFQILLKLNQGKYDFAAENCLDISKVSNNWKGYQLTRVSNSVWDGYKDLGGSMPEYYTIFGQTLLVAPIPKINNGIITFWGEQLKTIILMDDDVPPEIPELFDAALTYGIISRIIPDFEAKYVSLLRTAIERYENKSVSLLTPECEW